MDPSRTNKGLQMEDEQQQHIEEEKPVRLSLHVIVRRHLPAEAEKWDQQKMVEALNQITHLRLDREKIGEIDNFELLGDKVTNLYLQYNRIEKIENLECLKNLSFITLANNRLQVIENLSSLQKLIFLDLSENIISTVEAGDIPESVVILNLKGNPCTEYPHYRRKLIHDMPKLKQLDLMEVTKKEKSEVGHDVSSDEEEDDDEDDGGDDDTEHLGGNGHGKEESAQTLATKLMVRSQHRLEDSLKAHKKHTAELDDLRVSWNAPPSSRLSARSDVSISTSLSNSQVTVQSSK